MAALPDQRSKRIPVWIPGVFFAAAAGANLFDHSFISKWELWAGAVPGALLLLLSIVLKGKIGEGDGICLAVCGLFTGITAAVMIAETALLMAALVCMKRELEGYMTLEAAMIFPAVFALVIMVLYATFFLYDKCRMTQDLYTAAYRQSIARGDSTPDVKIDTSNYFMLSSCSAETGGGSDITASVTGEMAPALLTGTGDEGAVWELKVTMKARKTDPPRSFRRFRRIAAIAQQAVGD